MYNAHPRFICYPSVVQAEKETTVTIFPADTSRRFREEYTYELGVYGLMDDQLDYQAPDPLDHPFTIKGGCLHFTHFFNKEQEYRIRLRINGEPAVMLSMYAVEEDLYSLRPLKGDLHSHSWYSDGTDGPAMVPADYREEGFDFFALTDHNRMFTSQLLQKLYGELDLGMHIMAGEEVHTPGSSLHIVHAGGSHSVCEQYINAPASFETETAAMEAKLTHIPEQFRHRMALAIWGCEKIHEAGGIAILAHPYWQPDQYNVSADFADLLFDEKIFDAFELAGGVDAKGLSQQLALWQEQSMRGNRLNVVGSSDSHNHDFDLDKVFGRRFTIAFAKENSTQAILEAIKGGYSVAGELAPGSNKDAHFYGSLRLVNFSHFLFQHYFSRTWRLCVGEGILMRRWAMGEDVAEVLNALAPTVENFYKRFYGLTPAPVLNEKQTAFLDEALAAQQKGPLSKGSKLDLNGKNARRE